MSATDHLAAIGLNSVRKVMDLWRAGKSDSLIDYTQVARVEPIVLVDAAVLFDDTTPEVMQSLLSIFSGYYLQAAALSGTVGKIEVMRHLDRLQPKRNPIDSAADTGATWYLAQESYKFKLPKMKDCLAMESIAMEAGQPNQLDILKYEDGKAQQQFQREQAERDYQFQREKFDWQQMTDADRDEFQRAMFAETQDMNRWKRLTDDEKTAYMQMSDEAKAKFEKEKFGHQVKHADRTYQLAKDRLDFDKGKSEFGFGRDTMTTLKELANLSVGKMYSIEISDGMHKASFPISIRLISSSLPTAQMVSTLALGSKDTSVKARWHGWRSGRLEFWKDLVLCNDLIDEHRKALMHDKDGMYTEIVKRQRGNALATIVSANPSIATASNMAVIASTTADQLEYEIKGNLKDFKTRQRIFEKTSLMIMAVLDKDFARVTFYHRGIATKTEVGMRDLKAANKGNGPDVADILRAYQAGHSPSL